MYLFLDILSDYSIYHDQLVVVDPSGVTLHGLDSYKNAFRVVHLLVDVFFDHDMLTFRMCYDTARHVIRVSWNAELCPRFFGKPQHIDGISVYEIHPQTGMIVAHKVEHLLFNNVPVRDGIQQAMTMEIKLAAMMMKQSKSITSTSTKSTNTVLPFQLSFPTMKQQQKQSYSLFSASSSNNADTDTTNNSNNNMDVDWDKYHSKNKSRVKFGLAKLTLEEFLDLEQQVKQMEVVERAKYVSSDSTAATTTTPKKSNAWMNQLFGQKNTCESNFDCTRPELCCDFGFMKKCCASGSMVGQQIPVRVIADQQLPPDEMYGRQRERR